MKVILLRLCLALGALFLAAAPLHAQGDLGQVRARMAERLHRIDLLKSAGSLGENNRGLLEVRDGNAEAAKVAEEENRDRQTVYAAIAKSTGATPESVAAARARQIAAGSASGVWVQRENGEWYRK